MDTKWQREIIGEKEITFIFNFCFIVLASSGKHLLRYSDNKELHPMLFYLNVATHDVNHFILTKPYKPNE